MQLHPGIVSAITTGTAAASILLTVAVFILLRRHEALVAAKKEAMMAPIVREKKDRAYYIRRSWLCHFDEYQLRADVTASGVAETLSADNVDEVLCCVNGVNFHFWFCIPGTASPGIENTTMNENGSPAPHDLSTALSHYFGNKLDLGLDPQVVQKMLYDTNWAVRTSATNFLLNKVALVFCNFESDPEYSLLPPKLLELGAEIRARGFETLDNLVDKCYANCNENRFYEFYNRWRVLTYKLYGREKMPPQVQASIDRRVDFLLTVLGPFVRPEAVLDARAKLQEKMKKSVKTALFCAGQIGLIINDWDYVGPKHNVVYRGTRPNSPFRHDGREVSYAPPGVVARHQRYPWAPFL